MHNTIAANLTDEIKAALTTYGPVGMRKVYDEIHKVLWENFKTKIFFITPGCSTCEYILVDQAYKEVSKKIKFEFEQAYNYSNWNLLNELLFNQAIDRLVHNLHNSLTYRCPAEVYICCSQPGAEDSYYNTKCGMVNVECRYGLFVKVIQIDRTIEEFDLLEVYRSLREDLISN